MRATAMAPSITNQLLLQDTGRFRETARSLEDLAREDGAFARHRGGVVRSCSACKIEAQSVLEEIYSPGAARVARTLVEHPELTPELSSSGHTVAIISDGTAVLSLGDVGPEASLPVLGSKAALFEQLAGLDAVPIALNTAERGKTICAIEAIAPSFAAIMLEDIRAPECFEIEAHLNSRLAIPVLHDDRACSGVAVLAALINAARYTGRHLFRSRVGVLGLGPAGIGAAQLLLTYGAEIVGSDVAGDALTRIRNLGGRTMALRALMSHCDMVVAATGCAGLIEPSAVRPGQIILALSNPEPEIHTKTALSAGAAIAAEGKTVNNLLAYPGLFRGAIEAKSRSVSMPMLFAAAQALADHARAPNLLPSVLDRDAHARVADAVRRAV